MMNVDDKIKAAKEMCKGIWVLDIDNKFKYIYPFTTENIAGYLPYFDLKDKSLLTVGSSGDQALNAILKGANEITIADLCIFAKEYFALKKAAIASLSREDFLKFFCYYHYDGKKVNNQAFGKKEYSVLRDALKSHDMESAYFWDYFFDYYRTLKIRKRLFGFDETGVKTLGKYNEYLASDMAYDELRNKIDKANVDFKIGNVEEIECDRKYDNIFLSNINNYSDIDAFKKIFDNMSKYLNDDGRMLIAYLYLIDALDMEHATDKQKESLNQIISILPDDIDMYSFIGAGSLALNEEALKDSIITYKKVKKI